jgi:MFS family permease
VIVLLASTNLFNFMDRAILGALTEPIKADLGLSDTQMGLLGGLAFAFFYAIMGIPIARLADRGNRRNILSAAIAVWSAMTAACGLAGSFAQMFLCRVGVGVGEAGGLPPANSMIADFFPPDRRARAMAAVLVGAIVGTLIGMVAGARIGAVYGWHTAFFALGLPGMVFAILVRLTLVEPPRRNVSAEARASGGGLPFRAAIRILARRKTFVHLVVANAIASFANSAAAQWAVPFLMRSFDVEMTRAATAFGLIALTSTAVAMVVGGVLGDLLARRDLRWQLWIPAIGLGAAFPLAIVMYLAPSFPVALALAVPYYVLIGLYAAPLFAAMQGVVESELRALSAAVAMFAVSIGGLGLGPLAIGALSDQLAGTFGKESLRYALLSLQVLLVWSTVHLTLASRSHLADVAAVNARSER